MSLLPPRILEDLARSRLRFGGAVPGRGVGDRRSKATGPGIEFADHRLYQPGDDIRHLDRHAYARHKQHVIRQYSLYQPLPVTILIDASASMGFGRPKKLDQAAQLAGVLAYVSLTGNDVVQVGAYSAGEARWYPRLQGAHRSAGLFAWLERLRAAGDASPHGMARATMQRLNSGGLLIVLSDFMGPGLEEGLALWESRRQETIGIHVLAPEELEPERLGTGPARLIDGETGFEARLSLDADTLRAYDDELRRWSQELETRFASGHARLMRVRTDQDLETDVLRTWRESRLIS